MPIVFSIGRKKKENNRLVLNGKWGSWSTFIQRVSHCNMIKIMRQNKDWLQNHAKLTRPIKGLNELLKYLLFYDERGNM